MLLIQGWARFPPEAIDRFRSIAVPFVETVRADEGCLMYSWAEAVDDPGLFHSVMRWRSREDYDAHFTAPHTQEFLEAVGDLMPLDVEGLLFSAEEVERLF